MKQLGAAVLPLILPDQLIVEMEDGSIFQGTIRYMLYFKVPYWMQPNEAHNVQNYYAFIRTATKRHFISVLKPLDPLDPSNSAHYVPKNAEIRLGNYEHLKAESFQLHVPTHRHTYYRMDFPTENYIYITKPQGAIYSSILENYLSVS